MVSAATSVIQPGNTPEDIILNVLPLSSSYGLHQVLTGFKIGGTVVWKVFYLSACRPAAASRKKEVRGYVSRLVAAVLLQMDLDLGVSFSVFALYYECRSCAAG
jgi:hypothetical protein